MSLGDHGQDPGVAKLALPCEIRYGTRVDLKNADTLKEWLTDRGQTCGRVCANIQEERKYMYLSKSWAARLASVSKRLAGD